MTYLTVTGSTRNSLDFEDENSNFYEKVTEYIGTPDGYGGKTVYNYMQDYSSKATFLISKEEFRFADPLPISQIVNTYSAQQLFKVDYFDDVTLNETARYIAECCLVAGIPGQSGATYFPSCPPTDPVYPNYIMAHSTSMTIGHVYGKWYKLDKAETSNRSGALHITQSVNNYYKSPDAVTGIPEYSFPNKMEYTLSNNKVRTIYAYSAGDVDPDNTSVVLGLPEMWDKTATNYKYFIQPVKTRVYVDNNLKFYDKASFEYRNSADILIKSSYERHS